MVRFLIGSFVLGLTGKQEVGKITSCLPTILS